jgi:hypothetical protein
MFARTKEKKRQEQEIKSYASSQDRDPLRHGAVGERLRGNRAMEHVARISVMIRNVGMAMLVVALSGCSALRNPAKASVATGAMEEFDSLPDLLRTLTPDEEMRQRDLPPERTAAEERNVAVNVWGYAATLSFDGDYHMVFGSAPELPAQFMTAEVRRAPLRSVDHTKTLATREQFRAIFGHPAWWGIYSRFKPPVHVRITGSLFFDIDHHPGDVGPHEFASDTTWEIHPVTSISVLK